MKPYVCDHCGFWRVRHAPPLGCPVCEDFRHSPPDRGYHFETPEELSRRVACRWQTDEAGVTAFWNEPAVGIGPRGYLIEREDGNILFENAVWYSDAALDFMYEHGGARWASASHPHAYGGLRQVQERFRPLIYLPKVDLPWAESFSVHCPYDNRIQLTEGAVLVRSGGHFRGHALLWLSDVPALFVGDMLKLHFEDGRLAGLSTHKAFNRRIPMTAAELRRYRALVARLSFERLYTTFDALPRGGQVLALRLFDRRLQGFPSTEPVAVEELLGVEA